jgi:hypothetical protein
VDGVQRDDFPRIAVDPPNKAGERFLQNFRAGIRGHQRHCLVHARDPAERENIGFAESCGDMRLPRLHQNRVDSHVF